MKCSCRSEWWVEQRVIRPAAQPSTDPHLPTTASEIKFRLVCAECGAKPGETKTTTPRRRANRG